MLLNNLSFAASKFRKMNEVGILDDINNDSNSGDHLMNDGLEQ